MPTNISSVHQKILLPLALVLGLAMTTASAGCGSHESAGADELGAVGVQLQASPGVTFNSFTYTVTGPGGFTRSGTVDISHSATLSAIIAALPAGSGFSITIAMTSADGSVSCGGSAAFAVAAHATTSVTIHLQCHEAPRAGSVLVGGTINICPLVDGIAANPAEVTVGSTVALAATAHDTDAAPAALTYHWTASAGTISNAAAANPTFTCTVSGAATLTVAVSDGDCGDSLSVTVTCTGVANVRINEVESSGGVPGDWVELFNAGTAAADISGWKFKDNDDSHAFYIVPPGTTVPAGAYYLLEEAAFVFGLGAADSARLYDAAGNSVETYSWTAHAATTYGRCPNGSGPFVTTASSTKGAANDCGSSTGTGGAGGMGGMGGNGGAGGMGGNGGVVGLFPWPGTDPVVTVDDANTFGTNLSGLNYQPAAGASPAVLWAIQNGPSKLHRLLWNGSTWSSDAANNWTGGKLLHYPNGLGGPDTEGVSKAEWADSAIYVSTERDNENNGISRLAILRFDTNATGPELTATNEWNVTADLPAVGPNLGLEAITYIPDAALVAGGFFDESTAAAYNPSHYPNHGTGLFFVGLEGNGSIYGYALDHMTNAFTRVATLPSGQVSIMDLAYDREVGFLWGYCDNTCANKATVFRIDGNPMSPTAGRFQIGRVFDHPSTLPDSNNEGITLAPESECVAGQKAFFWSDDDQLGGHAIRRGSIPCGRFF